MAERPRLTFGAVAIIFFVPVVLWVVAEIALIIWVAQLISWWTLAAMLATSVLGVVLFERIGKRQLQRLSSAMTTGILGQGARHQGLTLTGSLLLILPGFLSDLLGLCLVVPPTRALVASVMGTLAARGKRVRVKGPDIVVIEGEIADLEPSKPSTSNDGPRIIEGTVVEYEYRDREDQ